MSQKKIGIMGAMPEEISALQAQLTSCREVYLGDRCYLEGQLAGVDVVLVFSRWGKVAAAMTATTLITHFGITHLIFTGVAGAVVAHLEIGDVVLSERLFHHDLNASPLFPKHTIPLKNKKFISADTQLLAAAKTVTQTFIATLDQCIDDQHRKLFGITQPSAHVGIIGSGDQFVGTSAQVQEIVCDTPEILAVEMEGAAVAQVCEESGVPFVVIRVVSDKANYDAYLDFKAFIQDIAAQYALHLVVALLKELDNE